MSLPPASELGTNTLVLPDRSMISQAKRVLKDFNDPSMDTNTLRKMKSEFEQLVSELSDKGRTELARQILAENVPVEKLARLGPCGHRIPDSS